MKKPTVAAIAAIGKDRALGKGNKLLWSIPEDLKRFRELTSGHPIILGRKTFESILGHVGKPLPNRHNIVVTRDAAWSHPGVSVARSIEEAIEMGKLLDGELVTIGGGAQIYEAALPYADKLFLTLIDDAAEADSFFPAYEHIFTEILADDARESGGLRYRWLDLGRRG